jgi:hypothetical protein
MVYSADQFGEAKEKKIKASHWMKVCVCYLCQLQRIWRELRICARLQHKNVLPICGYTFGFGPLRAIVSPWAENGNLTAYLEHSGAALTIVRRFQIVNFPCIICQRQTDGNVSSEILRMACNIVCVSIDAQARARFMTPHRQFTPTMSSTATSTEYVLCSRQLQSIQLSLLA